MLYPLLAQLEMALVKPSRVYSVASTSTLPKRLWQVLEVAGPIDATQPFANKSCQDLFLPVAAVSLRSELP